MRAFVRLVAICTLLCLVGCSQSTTETLPPCIKIEAGAVTATSVSFMVTVTGADECAYMLYNDGELTAERVLSDGVSLDTKGITTIDGLESDTTYYVVAAARNAHGKALSNVLPLTTKQQQRPPVDVPNDPEARTLDIVKTTGGRWYATNNYYVTLVAATEERIILDFYTIAETMSSYLPYGTYSLNNTLQPYTISSDYSGIILQPDQTGEDGYLFTDGYVSVDVVDGAYALYFYLSYEVDATTHTIQGYYNGPLSGTSVPSGDGSGEKLLELLETTSSSFKFRVNATEGQYWRCSVVAKTIYSMTESNPGAWVLTYGFLMNGPMTINWVNGEQFIPGYVAEVGPSMDYLIFAVLVDSETGYDMQSGVEVLELRTDDIVSSDESVDIAINNITAHSVTYTCTPTTGVDYYRTCVLKTELVEEAEETYAKYGYASFDAFMTYLVESTASESRMFWEATTVEWSGLWYNYPYTVCTLVVDKNGGKSIQTLDFHTPSE